MRRDAVGFWWNDAPVPKPPKDRPPKRQPPERTWERPDHLPGLAEAMAFNAPFITDEELFSTRELYFDIECFANFFCIGFMSKQTGRVLSFAMSEHEQLDAMRVKFIVENFTIKGFNSYQYDLPILTFALQGYSCSQLKSLSDEIIVNGTNPSDLLRSHKLRRIKCDHVDLFEVCPLFNGLKTYGGRIHVPRMQDLPFNAHTVLSYEQMQIVRWYNVNDLVQTWALDHTLVEQQRLRATISAEIGIDVRSKSDAQIAEAVIAEELFRKTRSRARRPEIPPGTVFRYRTPEFLKFQTSAMQDLLTRLAELTFVVDHTGSVACPEELRNAKVTIGKLSYTMGIGGLHSTEESICHRAVGGYRIFEVDVESYYPRIVLNQRLYPKHLGEVFLEVYNAIVERRLTAKRTVDKATSDSLKITINGCFGKLGSPYSLFYAPDLLIQVTISGQLCLLMLIEMLEIYGLEVISANTDSISVKIHESQVETMRSVVKLWQEQTLFKTEEVEYLGMFSKDVNNYIAIKPDGKFKGKGLYANPWHSSNKNNVEQLKKNPATTVCVDAVIAYLANGVPINTTIANCKDFTKFVSVRSVTGGAVCAGDFLGKSVRWYYAQGEQPEMVSAKSGNKVPKSDGAKPCMQLPESFPDDVNYSWYENEAESILKLIGYT